MPPQQTLPGTMPRWDAHLLINLTHKLNRTIIAKRMHHGPLQIQKAFYPEGPVCHLYLLHPPGGIVGGDTLDINITLNTHAQGLLTTPAATKFYRSNGAQSQQIVRLNVQANAALEWLPLETILFNATQANATTQIHLHSDASYIGWDIVCFGLPAAKESFSQGYFRQNYQIWRDNKPLVMERGNFTGGDAIFQAHWGLANFPVMATLTATPATQAILHTVRERVKNPANALFSSTLINDVLVCRYLGQQAELAKTHFIKVWSVIRPSINNRPICIPRIWHT